MSDYDELYEDDFEDAELNSVANKSSPRGYAASTASSTTAAAAANNNNSSSSHRGHAMFAPSAAEFLADGIAVAAKPVRARGKQSMASSFSSYASSSADPLLGQGAHELSSSSPSSASSNGSGSARRRHRSRARSAKSDGADVRRTSSHTGGGRSAGTQHKQQPQPQPQSASGGQPAALPPYAANGADELNVVPATARHDAYAELGEDDEDDDAYRELGDAPAAAAVVQSSHHASPTPSPHRGYPVESSGARSTRSATSSGSPSPVRGGGGGGGGVKGSSPDHHGAGAGNTTTSSPNRPHPSNGNRVTDPLREPGRGTATDAPEPPPRHTAPAPTSTAKSHASRASSTASSHASTPSRDRRRRHDAAAGGVVAAAARASGPVAAHASPHARDVSGERHGSEAGSSGKRAPLHQSNFTKVEALEDDDHDAPAGRRSAAEIDAAATTVSDEESDDAADDATGGGGGGVHHGNHVTSSVTASHARAPSFRSVAYSDTFTNITATASAKQSHLSHPRSPSTAMPPSVAPPTHASSEMGSLLSPDADSGFQLGSGTHRSGVVMPLSLVSQHLSAAAAASTATTDATAAHSTTASAQASPTTTAPLSHASLRTAGSPSGPAAVGAKGRRRQLHAAAGETIDANAHVPAPTPPIPSPASSHSDSDTDERASALPSARRTPEARQQPDTPISAHRSERAGSTTDAEDRATLLLRIAELRAEVTAWDGRIAKQRVALQGAQAAAAAESQPRSAEAGAGRGRRAGPAGGRQRISSVERLPPARMSGAAGGRVSNRAAAERRLAKLRAENKPLEAKYARLEVEEGTGMGVQALVVRAEMQLQKTRERLKEVTAARRALENRDKRAAHTIEEVHRRMPTADELQQRQLNEGIYSRTGLLRTVKELRDKLERTRTSAKQMEEKFTELTALVRRKHLTSLTPKEYEALCATRDSKAKAIERHKAAIAVYANAVARELRRESSISNAAPSSGSSCANTPRKTPSSRGPTPLGDPVPPEQVIAEYESSKAGQLLEQQKTLHARRQALAASIEKLQRSVQQREEQIKANHAVAGLVYHPTTTTARAPAAPYVVDSGRSPAKPAPGAATSPISNAADPVAGSGAVAVRKSSLRDVLRSPTKRRQEPAPLAPAPAVPGPGAAASPNRLRDAVAAARTSTQEEEEEGSGSGSAAVPAGPSREAGAGRGSHRPAPPQLTTLAESAAAAEDGARDGQPQPALNGKAAEPAAESSYVDDDDGDAGDVEDAEAAGEDSIEAMLREIDEDNRRLGQAVFGPGASEAEDGSQRHPQHPQHPSRPADPYGNGVSSNQPAFLQELDDGDDDGVDGRYPEEQGGAPASTGAAMQNGRYHHDDARAGGAGVYDTFVEELDNASDVEDDVEEYVDEDEDAYEDDDHEALHHAGGAAREAAAAVAGGSGRSTPEWLRDD